LQAGGAGILSAIALIVEANAKFGVIKTSLFSTPLGPIYIAIIALAINLAVSVVGSAIASMAGWRPETKIKEEEITKEM